MPRSAPGGVKDVDSSYDIVRLHNGSKTVVVESMAAVALLGERVG